MATTINATFGQAQAINGREAAAQATHLALENAGREKIGLGIVFASHQYPIQDVLNGVATLAGDTPLFGMSVSGEITPSGIGQRSVIVALLSGSGLQARADWWPGFGDDGRPALQKITQGLQQVQTNGVVLLSADGLNGDADWLCDSLPANHYEIAGALASGDLRRRRSYQIGGRLAGQGGLSAAFLNGNISIGVGLGHGWKPVGADFQISNARGPWIRAINHRTPAEAYANLMGYNAREWAFPPLNELVRLYPLGFEIPNSDELLVRSPLRVETDGSLRMHTAITEGSSAYFMLGSSAACQQAAETATRHRLLT